jgi:hypothetical protein
MRILCGHNPDLEPNLIHSISYANPNLRYILDRSVGAKSGLPSGLSHSALLGDTAAPFVVLGIETSCDDTGVAVVRSDGTVLSNVVISQHAIHEQYGGIFPSLAMEAHRENILGILCAAHPNHCPSSNSYPPYLRLTPLPS